MVCLCGIVCIGSPCKAARGNGHCRQHQHGQGAAQQPDGHSIHITVHHFQAPFPQAARRTPFRPGQHPFSWLRAPSIGPQRSQTRKKAQSEHTPGSIVCVEFMIALRADFVKKNEELSPHSILAFISFIYPRTKVRLKLCFQKCSHAPWFHRKTAANKNGPAEAEPKNAIQSKSALAELRCIAGTALPCARCFELDSNARPARPLRGNRRTCAVALPSPAGKQAIKKQFCRSRTAKVR